MNQAYYTPLDWLHISIVVEFVAIGRYITILCAYISKYSVSMLDLPLFYWFSMNFMNKKETIILGIHQRNQ